MKCSSYKTGGCSTSSWTLDGGNGRNVTLTSQTWRRPLANIVFPFLEKWEVFCLIQCSLPRRRTALTTWTVRGPQRFVSTFYPLWTRFFCCVVTLFYVFALNMSLRAEAALPRRRRPTQFAVHLSGGSSCFNVRSVLHSWSLRCRWRVKAAGRKSEQLWRANQVSKHM